MNRNFGLLFRAFTQRIKVDSISKNKITLPRDDDKIISGYLGFVAICVTQPLWPQSVPLSFKVSVIFTELKNYEQYSSDANTTPTKSEKNEFQFTEIDLIKSNTRRYLTLMLNC